MNFKRKLYLGFGSVLIILIITAAFGLYNIQEQNKNMKTIVNEHYERVRQVNIFQFEINNTARMIRDVILKKENTITREEEASIAVSRKNTADAIEKLKEFESNDNVKLLVTDLDLLNKSYEEGYHNIVKLLKEGNKEGAIKVLIEDNREVRAGLTSTSAKLLDFEENAMNNAVAMSRKMYQTTLTSFLYLISISIIIVVLISFWVVRSIISRINHVNSVISNVAELETNKLPRIDHITNDEIGEIALAYNGMATSLENHMDQENDLKEKMKIENWVKSNFIDLTTMYQGIQDVQTFARLFISKITPITGATYGVFYVKAENEDKYLKIAAYADSSLETSSKTFYAGEGLIGQAVLENKPILIDSLPEDYVKIRSGIGQSSPKYLLITPIAYEGKVIAVFELGSFTPFDENHYRFLDITQKTVGVSLHSIIGHMKIEKLLAESQTLTEELQSQSEELQQQQEELRMINEQLEEQYKSSEEKTKELEKIQIDLEEKNRHVELSSKYKSEFLANMSHELRTPLNSMLILSQLLADNNDGNLTEKQVEYASTIHSSGKDLLDLINDILDLSKIESGKMAILPEEVLFSDIQYFVEHQFTPIATQRKLGFEIVIDENLPYVFITDNQRLKQILKNLLSNAFKFTQQGKVVIEFKLCKNQDYFKEAHKPMVAISVTDTGIGISREKQNFIFEAFNQADGTTSRKFGGTGLGLSISKELAQLLGGFIDVESILGKGSTFTLYLPEYDIQLNNEYTREEVAATVIEEAQIIEEKLENNTQVSLIEGKTKHSGELKNIKEMLAGKKVLLVDDDMRNIFSLTTALETNKMIVEFAENGQEAIEILKKQSDIDLVLMDIMMPVMNGYEAIQEIRKMEGFLELPIIALTAKAMKNDREKCLDAGASDYISKPVNLDQLLSLIRVWLYR
ncbi:response regulator [Schinkia azotoformans]|uniref:response regulator n=1 Tax=Schinkia azotoformans TaxID=1454 RepID=UPI002DBDF2E4|nr:response regulator [Schinkia azotoformans]MEC1721269.1 response regulator [Schinkia azotoformans]MED4414416.1 response regulator [Schinkia azotoformans]